MKERLNDIREELQHGLYDLEEVAMHYWEKEINWMVDMLEKKEQEINELKEKLAHKNK